MSVAGPGALEKPEEVLEADLTWNGEALEPGIQVAVDATGQHGPASNRICGAPVLTAPPCPEAP